MLPYRVRYQGQKSLARRVCAIVCRKVKNVQWSVCPTAILGCELEHGTVALPVIATEVRSAIQTPGGIDGKSGHGLIRVPVAAIKAVYEPVLSIRGGRHHDRKYRDSKEQPASWRRTR